MDSFMLTNPIKLMEYLKTQFSLKNSSVLKLVWQRCFTSVRTSLFGFYVELSSLSRINFKRADGAVFVLKVSPPSMKSNYKWNLKCDCFPSWNWRLVRHRAAATIPRWVPEERFLSHNTEADKAFRALAAADRVMGTDRVQGGFWRTQRPFHPQNQ